MVSASSYHQVMNYPLTAKSPAFAAVVSGASGSARPSVDLSAAGVVGSCPVSSGAGTGLQSPLPPVAEAHPQLMACTLDHCLGNAQPAAPADASHPAAGKDE